MASSYYNHTTRLISNVNAVSNATFKLIGDLDESIDKLAKIIDNKLKSVKDTDPEDSQSVIDDVKKLVRVIEDLTEKKAQLTVRNYDLIDHNMKIVDHELQIIRKAKRSRPNREDLDISLMKEDNTRNVALVSNSETQNHGAQFEGSTYQENKRKVDSNLDFAIDPNEPVYCFCRQVAYGDMVQCDNEECEIEWFHYPCVNLTKTPKSRWLCPTCVSKTK